MPVNYAENQEEFGIPEKKVVAESPLSESTETPTSFQKPYSGIPKEMGYVGIEPEEGATPLPKEAETFALKTRPDIASVFRGDIMTEEDFENRMRVISEAEPERKTLPPIPLHINLLMLSIDAFRGKTEWLDFILNDRTNIARKWDAEYTEAEKKYNLEKPILISQLREKYEVDKQRFGERVEKRFAQRGGIEKQIAEANFAVKKIDIDIKKLQDERKKGLRPVEIIDKEIAFKTEYQQFLIQKKTNLTSKWESLSAQNIKYDPSRYEMQYQTGGIDAEMDEYEEIE